MRQFFICSSSIQWQNLFVPLLHIVLVLITGQEIYFSIGFGLKSGFPSLTHLGQQPFTGLSRKQEIELVLMKKISNTQMR